MKQVIQKNILKAIIFVLTTALLTSCWFSKYRSYQINDQGDIVKSSEKVLFERKNRNENYVRDYYLVYNVDGKTSLDTNQMKSNALLLISKINDRRVEQISISFLNDLSGTINLDCKGCRDFSRHCSFLTRNNKCFIHYRSSSGKF